jgi:hypothetical protein
MDERRIALRRCLHLLEWYDLGTPPPWRKHPLTLAELHRLWRAILSEAVL